MSKAFIAAGLVALATAADPDVAVACVEDDNITITIDYTKPNVSLIAFTAGDCNEANVSYVQNATSNVVEINMNMRACGLRGKSRVTRGLRGSLRTIHFDNIADLQLGRTDEALNKDFVFYSNKVNLTCGVKDTYTVSLEYGKIDADYSGDQIAGGEKVYDFSIKSVDSDYNATIEPSSRAGDTVYLSIQSEDVDFELYKFAVLDCTFAENNGTADVTTYKLFDNTQNDCNNEFLDFTMKYCNKTNSFKLSHTVFTFDPTKDNNYTLSCSIKLCDFDVTASVEVCNTVEKNCDIPTIEPNPGHIHGEWSEWSETWTGCEDHKKCTECEEKRNRTCNNPAPENGGNECVGNSTETRMKAHSCVACDLTNNGDLTYKLKDSTGLQTTKYNPCIDPIIFNAATCEQALDKERNAVKNSGYDLDEWRLNNKKTTSGEEAFQLGHYCPNLCALKQKESERTCLPKKFCKDEEKVVFDYEDSFGVRAEYGCEWILSEEWHKTSLQVPDKSFCGMKLEKVKEHLHKDGYFKMYSIKKDGADVADDTLFADLCGMTCAYGDLQKVHEWTASSDYCVLEKANGGLSEWSEWANTADCDGLECGKRCERVKVKTCTNPRPVRGGADCNDEDPREMKEKGLKICDECLSESEDHKNFRYQQMSPPPSSSAGMWIDDACWNVWDPDVDYDFSASRCSSQLSELVKQKYVAAFTVDEGGVDKAVTSGHPAWLLTLEDMCPNRCQKDKPKTCNYKGHPCKKDDANFKTAKGSLLDCTEAMQQWVADGKISFPCESYADVLKNGYNYQEVVRSPGHHGDWNEVLTGYTYTIEDVCATTCQKAKQIDCDAKP